MDKIIASIVLIIVGIVIIVWRDDEDISFRTPTFEILGAVLIDIGIGGVFYNHVYSFIEPFFPDDLWLCRILTILLFVALLVFFVILIEAFESFGKYTSKKHDKKYVTHLIIHTKNFSEVLLKKDNKKKIITNKTSMDIDKEDYAMFISIEYDADRELDSLIEMIDYVFDNDDKICTMILENLAVNSLEVDAFLLLEVTICCEYIELCCCVGLFDTIDFKLDWETKELVKI